VTLTVSNNFSKQSCSVSTSVTSALEVNLTICAIYIHILLIAYLLLLFFLFQTLCFKERTKHLKCNEMISNEIRCSIQLCFVWFSFFYIFV